MAVLYRKYRPQTFDEVFNQKYIIQTLKNQIKSGQVAHAYLFTGSRGVGKTTVARILAKAVNCLNIKDGEACGECANCKAIADGGFLDLVEVDAASNTGVDNIRDLIEHVKFSPTVGKYKVFIIDEVHMLSKGAFNALLKTLEEPPKHALFILATTEINKVPATIISRTQRFDFKAYSAEDLLPLLTKVSQAEGLNFSKEILELVAQNAEGSARDSLSILDKLKTLGTEAAIEDAQQLLGITDISLCEDLLSYIAQGQAKELPEFFNRLLEKGIDFKILNRDFLEYLRKALVFKITDGQQNFGLSEARVQKLSEAAAVLSAADLMFVVRLFLRSYKDLESSPSPQIPLLLSAIEASLKKTALQALAKQSNQVAPAPRVQPKAQVKPPVLESVNEAQAASEPALSLEEVEKIWPKVITKVKEANGPLSSMMRGSQLVDVLGNKLVVNVKFLFDKQNLENLKNSAVIAQAFESVCGKKISLSAQVTKQSDANKVSAPEALNQALQIFGGELVE